MKYFCCADKRRNAVDQHATLNAIDYIEVADLAPAELTPEEHARYLALPPKRRKRLLWQRRLTLHFINPLTPQHVAGLSAGTIAIDGGERIRGIRVDVLAVGGSFVVLRASAAGDFSHYRLSLVRSTKDRRPPPGFDPVLSTVRFSFKVDCPSEFDCRTDTECPEEPEPAPVIDYLAKDYSSFRRLMLDRMSQILPDWRERNAADVGVALVEVLAYVGDHLSYQQDAVSTEAYLDTARRRTSVRRHAVLVDYFMHDGCNARVWLQIEVSADMVIADPTGLRFFTKMEELPLSRVNPASPEEQRALESRVEWFEPVLPSLNPAVAPDPIALFTNHHLLKFYTWGDDRCCLPKGATQAVLDGHYPSLEQGSILIFEEVKGPHTGIEEDADPRHRHAVRLTRVTAMDVDYNVPLVDPLNGRNITEIEWDRDDALPFALCLSSIRERDGAALADISVARGNILLADHGRAVTQELGVVPGPALHLAEDGDRGGCQRERAEAVPVRFRPALSEAPVTRAGTMLKEKPALSGVVAREFERVRFDASRSAQSVLRFAMRDVRPEIQLNSTQRDLTPARWSAVRDLLNSSGSDAAFVVETEHDGSVSLRFGDDEHGRRPREGERFDSIYRTGNGPAGNVGSDSIVHVVSTDSRIVGVRNPLPARGGQGPETVEQVKRHAPQAFRVQERAVTPSDYEAVTRRNPAVQRAAASLRWTGSWHTVFLTVDPFEGQILDGELESTIANGVERYRMAGHDLEIDAPRYVPIELELFVCVTPEYFRADVKARLLDLLSNRNLSDGRRGLFHADNFTFAQTIYLSPILAAVHDVAGVESATVLKFERQGTATRRFIDDGRMQLGRLEIARLDNDQSFPERGVLRLRLGGGK